MPLALLIRPIGFASAHNTCCRFRRFNWHSREQARCCQPPSPHINKIFSSNNEKCAFACACRLCASWLAPVDTRANLAAWLLPLATAAVATGLAERAGSGGGGGRIVMQAAAALFAPPPLPLFRVQRAQAGRPREPLWSEFAEGAWRMRRLRLH